MARVCFSLRLAACLLGGVLALAAFQTPTPEKKASLQGKISGAVTGEPIKKATVMLSGHGSTSTMETNEKGEFLFENLEPGRYTLMAQKTGFAPGAYGARGNSQSGVPLDVTKGQEVKELNWKLCPNSVITGKVFDAEGEPVQNAMVMPMQMAFDHGKKIWAPAGQGMTNDQGEYRVANLKAGSYIVMASNLVNNITSSITGAAKPATDKAEPAYVTTYYPSVTEQSMAEPVMVAMGAEAGRIDVHMVKADSFRVKGRWDNAPTQGKMTLMVLTPKGSGLLGILSANRAQLNPDGSFEFRGVTPGDYELGATQDFISPMGGQMPVQVKDKHVSGLILQMPPSADVAGTFVVEGKNSDKVNFKHLTARLNPSGFMQLNPPKAQADESGKFTWTAVIPGRYEVQADVVSENVYVKSVKYAGREVEEDGIDLSAGPAGAVQITVNTEVCEVKGTVSGPDGTPMGGATVVLVPDSRRFSQFRSLVSDQKGAFDFTKVAPGEYHILAWEEVAPNQFQNPEFLAQYIAQAEAVRLLANDQKVFTLKAIPPK